MSQQLVVTLIPIGVVLLVLVVVLAMRRRVTSKLYAGTGLDDWREVAERLPWNDRWALYRANILGRAATPLLAGLAVQRGEVMVACSESMTARSSKFRKMWLVLGGFAVLLCGLNIALLVAGEREWHDWAQVVVQGWLAVLWLVMPALQRRETRRLSRSVERNRELVTAHQADGR